MGLFRLLLIFFVSYYAFRIISGFFRLRKTYFNSSATTKKEKRSEGEISISVDKAVQKKKVSKDEGDYIEYEDL